MLCTMSLCYRLLKFFNPDRKKRSGGPCQIVLHWALNSRGEMFTSCITPWYTRISCCDCYMFPYVCCLQNNMAIGIYCSLVPQFTSPAVKLFPYQCVKIVVVYMITICNCNKNKHTKQRNRIYVFTQTSTPIIHTYKGTCIHDGSIVEYMHT